MVMELKTEISYKQFKTLDDLANTYDSIEISMKELIKVRNEARERGSRDQSPHQASCLMIEA
jgi:hypothetical protein